MDNLDRDIREAQRLGYGVHYGMYKADHPHTRDIPMDVAVAPPKQKSAEAAVAPKICRHCGKEFYVTRNLRSFCSESCKRLHSSQLAVERTQRKLQKKAQRTCKLCGKAFVPAVKTQVYCGRSCAGKAKGKLFGVVYKCAGCGKEFKPRTVSQKYCGLTCFNRNRPHKADDDE